jgi:tRNA pseudouridine38-40 synthase
METSATFSQVDSPVRARNLLLRVAYDGADFSGWQIQPHRPTIQGLLKEALEKITGETVHIHGAGRTDAGVHACAQAASVELHSPIPCPNLVQALNDYLPASVRVLSAQEAPSEFHARRSARSKLYHYRIYRERPCPPWLARYIYAYPYPLDEDAMCKAAAEFEGTRDFRSFASIDAASRGADPTAERSTIRTIYSSRLWRAERELVYAVEGSGFLNHMVRNIVGTLIEVGRGNVLPGGISRILAAADRAAAGPTAPANGLWLVRVSYPEIPDDIQLPAFAGTAFEGLREK